MINTIKQQHKALLPLCWFLFLYCCGAGMVYAQPSSTYLLDLGDPANPTAGHWNNVTTAQSSGMTLPNLIDSTGVVSAISFVVVDQAHDTFGNEGFNTQGYNGVALAYPATACADSYFAHGTGGIYEFRGLESHMRYTIKLFGSRMAATGGRVGRYTMNGITQTLDGQNNTTNTVVFEDLQPSGTGTLTLAFNVAAGSTFGYINVLEVTEYPAPIQGPDLLTATLATPRDVILGWQDNSDNEAGFTLERRVQGNATPTFMNLSANATGYIDRNLAYGTTYEYRISSYNATDTSAFTAFVPVTTGFDPSAPRDKVFLLDLGNPANPTPGHWNNITTVQSTGMTLDNLKDTTGTTSSISFVVVEEAHDAFGVEGFNTQGYNGEALGYPATACGDSYFAHGAGGVYEFRGLDPQRDYTLRIFGSRTAPTGGRIGSYTINGVTQTLDGQNNTTNAIAFENLRPNGTGVLTLDFNVAAGSTFGYINVLELREQATAPLLLPSDLAITDLGHDFITLRWTDRSTSEIGFSIERSTNPTTGFAEIGTTSMDGDRFNDNGLTPSTTYYYRVKALGETGGSDYTQVLQVTTAEDIPVDQEQRYTPQYNGNISAIKWKGYGDPQEHLYTYHYDPMNRLKAAQYSQGATTNDTWTSAAQQGGFSVPHIGYDLNGNIQSLTRQSIETGTETIDALSYTYTNGNQLAFVSDRAGWSGFADRNTGVDYDYDDNGNMTQDLNKEITRITYNHLNLPDTVIKADGSYIKYIYDASGVKLAQEVYDASNVRVKKTDYLEEFIYENDALEIIQHEEGRLVPDATTGNWDYEYYLKDHLGNNRVLFTTKPKTHEFKATMESEAASEEEALFSNVRETRVTFTAASQSPNEVAELDDFSPIGPAISLQVGAGDTVKIEGYAYFEGGTGYNSAGNLPAFVAAVAGAFGGINGSGVPAEQATFDVFDNAYGVIGLQGTGSDIVPAAYLNYIFFDQNMTYKSSGFKQVSSSANFSKEYVTFPDDIVIEEPGFLYCFVSMESATGRVFWDDFEVTVVEHPVVQRDSYYPFGLQHDGGFNRVTSFKNDFTYNGKELQDELGLEWLDYGWRMLYPVLGRFFNIDPSAENYLSWTPYNYVANNPIRLIDPDGKDWFEDKDGNIIWNNSRDATFTQDDIEYTNIGSTLTITVQSYIHPDNDIPVPGVDGVKLETSYSITGKYDDDGNFTGFSTDHESNVGFTFGILQGADGVEGTTESFSLMSLNANGTWTGGFEHHTEVNALEKPGMYGMFGNVVDVNQKVNITVGSTGQLNIRIGHGTFPSVSMYADQAQNQKIYDFRQYSFLQTHGSGMVSDAMAMDGVVHQAVSVNQNRRHSQTNMSYVKFTGFTAGTK